MFKNQSLTQRLILESKIDGMFSLKPGSSMKSGSIFTWLDNQGNSCCTPNLSFVTITYARNGCQSLMQ